jgi:hypothetical protein
LGVNEAVEVGVRGMMVAQNAVETSSEHNDVRFSSRVDEHNDGEIVPQESTADEFQVRVGVNQAWTDMSDRLH